MRALKSTLVTALQARFSATAAAEIINQCGGAAASPGPWDLSSTAAADIATALGGGAAGAGYADRLRDLLFRGASSESAVNGFGSAMLTALDTLGGATYPNMAEDLETALFGLPRKKSYLWRNFATLGARAGEYEVSVPYEISVSGANKTTRYAVFSFQPYIGGVMHLGRIKDGAAALNVWHSAGGGAVTKSGGWSTVTNAARIPGPDGSTAAADDYSDYITFNSVTGHSLVLRFYTYTSGGFAFVEIDGSSTAATSLPAVQSGDIKTVNSVSNPSGSIVRLNLNTGHGFVANATIKIEGIAGLNGYRLVGTAASTYVELSGFVYAGPYTGGTCGFFGAGDVGKRYLSMYAAQVAFYDEHALLAEGLSDAAHSVTIRPTNTSYAGGAGSRDVYVTGVAGVSGIGGGATPDQTADHSIVYLHELSNTRTLYSAMVSAIELMGAAEAATPTTAFMGEVHGKESQVAQAWYVDERPVSPGLGQYASGTLIRNALRTALWHELFGLSVCADKTSDYFFSAYQRDACRVVSKVEWRLPGVGKNVYYGMLPIGKGNRHVLTSPYYVNDEFDRIYFGSTSQSGLGDNNDGWDGNYNTEEKATFYHSTTAHPVRARLRIDKAKNVNSWAATGAAIQFSNQDRADGLDKVYAARCSPNGEEAFDVGDVHRSDTAYHVFRQPNTSVDLEQDP